MKKLFALLAVLFITASFGISMDQYLHNGENLTGRNFNVSGTNYTLYSIGGSETFLVDKDKDVLITDGSQISSVIKSYYTAAYMLTPKDKADILALLDAFNASRNDGQIGTAGRSGMEEYECRNLMAVGVSNQIRNGDPDFNLQLISDNLDHMAIYISNDWIQGGTYGDANELKKVMSSFFNATFKLDKELMTTRAAIDGISENDAYSTLEGAKQSIDRMYAYKTALEKTLLRLPKTYGECPDCLGICYYIEMNVTALDQAKAKVAAAEAKAKNLSDTSTIADRITKTTEERIQFVKDKDLASYYSIKMSSIASYWDSTFPAINASLALIDNPSLDSKVSTINGNIASMNASIQALSLDGIDKKFNETSGLIAGAQSTALEDVQLYGALLNASAEADRVALLSKDNSVIAAKQQLDALMTIPVGYGTAVQLIANYTALANQSANVTSRDLGLSDQGSLIAARTINGFYIPLNLVERGSIKPYDNYAIMSAPALIAISLCALIAMFTISSYSGAKRSYSKGRVVMLSLAPGIVLMMVVVALSSAMYLFTSSIEDSKGPLMFMDYTHGKPVYIVANTADANSAMAKCASEIGAAMNKSGAYVTFATYDGAVCTLNGKKYATDCANKINDATISLSSGNYSINSRLFLVPTLEVKGSDADFARCAIAKLYELEK
jgi:hypothetical protein